MPNPSDWIREYFDKGYPQRWSLGPPSEGTKREADGLWDLLQLRRGSSVLDVGCGHGRHVLSLALRGAAAIGVDTSPPLLDRAKRLAAEAGVRPCFIRSDMRKLPLRPQQFRAAVLLDAFGFFDHESEHVAALREVARVLARGGRLALKVVNSEFILRKFRAEDREERDGAIIEIGRTLESNPPRLIERITMTSPRGVDSFQRRQRLFSMSVLCALVEAGGFAVKNVLGSASGDVFDEANSSAIFVIAALPVV